MVKIFRRNRSILVSKDTEKSTKDRIGGRMDSPELAEWLTEALNPTI